MPMFIPGKWFWVADDGRAYGSAKQLITNTADPDYVAWLQAGYAASIWPKDSAGNQTNASLQEVLTQFGLYADLTYYAANSRYNRSCVGVIITSLNTASFASDPVSRNTINSAYDFLTVNKTETLNWKMSDGTFITVDLAKVTTMMNDVADFVHKCYDCEATTVAAINGGTITTQAQVDAAFAAVTNVYP